MWPRAVTGGSGGAGSINATALYQGGVRVFLGSLGATDNAALRADGTGTFTAQGSSLIIADTTGALSRSGNGGIPVQGTNTNDDAAAGNIGEHISGNLASGSATSLTSVTAKTITSISLTAGDWEVAGWIVFLPAITTNSIQFNASISLTNNTLDIANDRINAITYDGTAGVVLGGNSCRVYTGSTRVSLSATTTVYLVGLAQFTVSTLTAYGHIKARRVR